jgi:hypothetical protein
MARRTVKPTAAEKAKIEERLRKKYPQMDQSGWGKNKSLMKEYAKQTGGGSFAGASGADLEELQKRFGKKKKR